MTQAIHPNRHDVESIAAELGIEYVYTQNENHGITDYKTARELDPDIIYLYEHWSGHPICLPNEPAHPGDAVLKYQEKMTLINWQEFTKATIRKMITDKSECIVCYQDKNVKFRYCTKCKSTVCTYC